MRSALATLFALVTLLTGCGPSEAEIKAAKEKEAIAKLKEHRKAINKQYEDSSARWNTPEKQDK